MLVAAGSSTRMGRPKMGLAWVGGRTLLGHVVHLYLAAGTSPVVIVTGADREAVEAAVAGLPVKLAHNHAFRSGGMFSSVKVGLTALAEPRVQAALISPADLPLLKVTTIREILRRWEPDHKWLLAPSYEGRRGHPILVPRALWPDLLGSPAQSTLREFLAQRAPSLRYVVVDDPEVVRDIDTPEEYREAFDEAAGPTASERPG